MSVFSTQGEYIFVFPVLGINVTSSFAEYGPNTFLNMGLQDPKIWLSSIQP